MLLLQALCLSGAAVAQPADLTAMPLESLLKMEVRSASKFMQSSSEAPSFVSVVTAADIKTHGWRTLADILRSLPGLYTSYDRSYTYLGSRGFLRGGDYNPRYLLMVDGVKTNDPTYDQAMLGSEFVLDLDLIDRVEYVPGPGSSIYGSNAVFGVINVITKSSRDLNGAQVSMEAGSAGAVKGRASYGWRDEGGRDLLISATGFHANGKDLYFPEFGGTAQGLDFQRGKNLFLKGQAEGFNVSLMHSDRTKGVPTANYGQDFNDPRSQIVDTQTMINAGYRRTVAEKTELNVAVFYNRYEYKGQYPYEGSLNYDRINSDWWGGEVRLVSTRFDRHKLVMGAEYQKNGPIRQTNYDLDPYVENLKTNNSNHRAGFYIQDEYSLRDDLLLNAGMRFDQNSVLDKTQFNPRLGLIYKWQPATSFKLMYGRSYRVPNAYERYYEDGETYKANPNVGAEHVTSIEAGVEHNLTPGSQFRLSAFRNKVKDLITLADDPSGSGMLTFQNIGNATAVGVEAEYKQKWADGTQLRSSVSWQQARDDATDAILANAPKVLAKLMVSTPFQHDLWRAGFEAQYVGSRGTLENNTSYSTKVGGYTVANLTVFSDRLIRGAELSAGIYNVFDHRYADPAGPEHEQNAIAQDGRTFRVKLTYSF